MGTNFSSDAPRVTCLGKGLGSYSLRAILASCIALTIFVGPGSALATDSDKNASGHRLIDHQRVQDMKERIADLRERMKHHQHNGDGTTTGTMPALQAKVTSLENSMTSLLSTNSTLLTSLQAAQAQLTTLQARIAALESKPAGGGGIPDLDKYVSINPNPINGVKGPHIIFTGANVHIRSGSGATNDNGALTGLGNLFVGYNELPPSTYSPNNAPCNRASTGSHNIVGGLGNLADSFGGLVVGTTNCLTGANATVLGGTLHEATGDSSTILGGKNFETTLPNQTVPVIR